MEMANVVNGNGLQNLIETEIPDGRQNLESSYANLERVAAYCEANYLQATDKQAAIEETRRYTVQSLASVAYQINTLATNLIQMLELQADKISGMESQVNNIAQIVDIHKEKVARREIGVLTATKVLPRQHKIITPMHTERPQKYLRRPIDYSILDDLGHGVKLQPSAHTTRLGVNINRTGSTVSGGSSGSGSEGMSYHGGPSTRMSTASGSLSKGSAREYRLPLTSNLQNVPGIEYRTPVSSSTGSLQQRSNPGSYSSVQVGMGQGGPGGNQTLLRGGDMYSDATMPPPMAPISVDTYRLGGGNTSMDMSGDGLPPPPSPNAFDLGYGPQSSPPLPPPPMDDSIDSAGGRGGGGVIPEMPQYGIYMGRNRNSVPDWVPQNYLEKVIAIYDYQAEKSDELSFNENSVIYVLKKNEDGWFEGVMDGVTGLFPGNYVEPCM